MNAQTTAYIPRASVGASTENHDALIELMRQILAAHPNIKQSEAKRLYKKALRNHEDYELSLRDQIEGYAIDNIYRRLAKHTSNEREERSAIDRENETEKVKQIIVADIVLWKMKLPTTGKTLAESTFAEVAEAAPLTGKFLAKLSACGAPGTLVKEVFKNEKALQEFWNSAQ